MRKNKGNKPYIFVLALLGIFFLIIFFTIGLDSLKNRNKNLYLIVDQSAVWEYNKTKWVNVDRKNYLEYNWKKCKYYEEGNFIHHNYLVYTNDRWYVFNANKDAILPNSKFLAVGGNKKVSVKNSHLIDTDQNDQLIIEQVLKENGISDYENYMTRSKLTTDLDNDQEEETLYVLSNMFPTDFSPTKIYNIVFVKDNDSIIYVYKDIDSFSNMYNHCKVYLNNIIDVDQDSKDEIIIGCGYYSTNGIMNQMYTLKNKEYKLLISNR